MNLSDAALHLSDDLIAQSFDLTSILVPGHAINKPEVLFRNITEEEVEQLRDRWATAALSHAYAISYSHMAHGRWTVLATCADTQLCALLMLSAL